MRKIIIILSILSLFFSCTKKDIKNVSLEGNVKNSITGKSAKIGKNEFLLECWKYGDKDRHGDPSYADFERVNIPVDKRQFYSSF